MTYKEGISYFKSQYESYCVNLKLSVKHYSEEEIAYLLSVTQKEINDYYNLINAQQTLTLIVGQSNYGVGSGASLIDPLCQKIKSILSEDSTELSQTNINYLNVKYPKNTISAYAFVYFNGANQLIFNAKPTTAEVLNVYYSKRADLWKLDNAGTVWANWNLSNTETYGGSFALPPDWCSFIVKGAVADAVALINPEYAGLKSNWQKEIQAYHEKLSEVTVNNANLTYSNGIW